MCKGLNRGLGTLIAGSLAFFIEFVANDSGKVLRAIFIGTAVFIIGMQYFFQKIHFTRLVRFFLFTLESLTVKSLTFRDKLYITIRLLIYVLILMVTGAAATYIRFIPYIKKNYDYGVVIFLLTFNLITVSSYRVDSVINIAHVTRTIDFTL